MMENSLEFDDKNYEICTFEAAGKSICCRVFKQIVYVRFPINPELQNLTIYVPETYYERGEEGEKHLKSVPIFFPNGVGGYMPSAPVIPGEREEGGANAAFEALLRGYVVVSAGSRGRGTRDGNGHYTGFAPACIVDQKAAVRYLRHNRGKIPGDPEKIISNGTSAGGALSALLGVTGGHPDYEPYLKELGAAEEDDSVFASSCYCPITNLEHGDMAYEWEFCGLNHWNGRNGSGEMDEARVQLSVLEKKLFPEYVNSLKMTDENGCRLILDSEGNGSFKDYVQKLAVQSAETASADGLDIAGEKFLSIDNGKVTAFDWDGFVQWRGRMKPTPAFDDILLETPENELFGTAEEEKRHFTPLSLKYDEAGGKMADDRQIHLMNPMNYIGSAECRPAGFFRIRHGTADSDASLAVSAILAVCLSREGIKVDYSLPWGVPHSGDYDLKELFAWMESVCDR